MSLNEVGTILLMNRIFMFGVSYALIWFTLITLISIIGLEFPLSWTMGILESKAYSEDLKIFGVRALWAFEFILYVFIASIPTAYMIQKFYPDKSNIDILKVCSVALLLLSLFLVAALPRFVPVYFSASYIVFCFIGCLLFSVACVENITSDYGVKS